MPGRLLNTKLAFNEIDLEPVQLGKCTLIDDDLEPPDLEDTVVAIDTVGESHAEADAATSA